MRMQNILESKNVKFTPVDIAADDEAKNKMIAALKAANKAPPYLAPQLFYGDEYIGGYDEFDEANENLCLDSFLRL
ncbi:unnamed protein product [Mesocestoides corti]|nr:unnamed protein product [Mesocestoides corti]